MTPTEIFLALEKEVNFDFETNPFWWEGYGSFWIIAGAILTQNAKWQGVERSLENLKNAGVKELQDLASIPPQTLAELVKPSGFYNTKAKRLHSLCNAILQEFGSFEQFCQNAQREWLLAQKGVGFESCDAILCYACKRDIVVIDAYTSKILASLGFEFESYDEASEWLSGFDEVELGARLGEKSREELSARFHGLFVEFGKSKKRLKVE